MKDGSLGELVKKRYQSFESDVGALIEVHVDVYFVQMNTRIKSKCNLLVITRVRLCIHLIPNSAKAGVT